MFYFHGQEEGAGPLPIIRAYASRKGQSLGIARQYRKAVP